MSGRRISHRNSHLALLAAPMAMVSRGTTKRSFDAIFVPSARKAHNIDTAASVACETGARLIVMASREAVVDDLIKRLELFPGIRALVLEVPEGYGHPWLTFEPGPSGLYAASAGRSSDLSLKRNIGLLLGMMMSWQRILFLDDDLIKVPPRAVERLSGQLQRTSVAGLLVDNFPDNSVVCHANRLSGAHQDVFVSGAALGLNLADRDRLPFFPDIYNEDWFFFYQHAAEGRLSSSGQAVQREFNPYKDHQRAAREEFGDTLAEALYALLQEGEGLVAATGRFWSEFLEARSGLHSEVLARLRGHHGNLAYQATRSVQAAHDQLQGLTPALCMDFISSWQDDLRSWRRTVKTLLAVDSIPRALDELGLKNWQSIEFGAGLFVDTSFRETSVRRSIPDGQIEEKELLQTAGITEGLSSPRRSESHSPVG